MSPGVGRRRAGDAERRTLADPLPRYGPGVNSPWEPPRDPSAPGPDDRPQDASGSSGGYAAGSPAPHSPDASSGPDAGPDAGGAPSGPYGASPYGPSPYGSGQYDANPYAVPYPSEPYGSDQYGDRYGSQYGGQYGAGAYGPGPYAPGVHGPGHAPGPPTSGLAIAALVCGVLGFFTAGLASIPAVICGHLAWGDTSSGRQAGHGLAVAGLVTGYIPIVGWLLFWVYVAVDAGTA